MNLVRPDPAVVGLIKRGADLTAAPAGARLGRRWRARAPRVNAPARRHDAHPEELRWFPACPAAPPRAILRRTRGPRHDRGLPRLAGRWAAWLTAALPIAGAAGD
jgi:hypothetical protein